MQEYPQFVYLDLQKTGSTFVINFLREHAVADAIVSRKHAWIQEHSPEKFYFITYRNPIDQYISLYSFGRANGNGSHYATLERLGLAHLYDGSSEGFSQWLNFTLKRKNARLFADDNVRTSHSYASYATSGLARLLGYMSYRFVGLSLFRPLEVLSDCDSRDSLWEAFTTQRIWNVAIRTDRLTAGLIELARGPLAPSLKDPEAAIAWLESSERRNASDRVDRQEGFQISAEDRKLIMKREWLFFRDKAVLDGGELAAPQADD